MTLVGFVRNGRFKHLLGSVANPMKLRMHRNSVRLRLNQGEVAQFSKTGYVEESIEFVPGASLSYVLESSSAIANTAGKLQKWGAARSNSNASRYGMGHGRGCRHFRGTAAWFLARACRF